MLYVGSRGGYNRTILITETDELDRQPIAKNAITILINLSHDEEIIKTLAEDDAFLETLLKKITVCQ
jgi:hypothetical protein